MAIIFGIAIRRYKIVMEIYLSAVGVINAVANSCDQLYQNYILQGSSGIKVYSKNEKNYSLGLIDNSFYKKTLAYPYNNRVNKLSHIACQQIEDAVQYAIKKYGKSRIGVILGTTDNGSEETNAYLSDKASHTDYTLQMQSLNLCSDYVKQFFGVTGISFTVSTACTSSANAIIQAAHLIQTNICDAVIAGGTDIVTDTVLLGFSSLDAVDMQQTKPFSKSRNGINLGEGASLFLLTKDAIVATDTPIILKGFYSNSDGFHMTSPNVEAIASVICLETALENAGMNIADIDYINLHGTGTQLNDIMESNTLSKINAQNIPCSSNKPAFGHTLGASASMELAVCYAALTAKTKEPILPIHIYDNDYDPDLKKISLVTTKQSTSRLHNCMNVSFAFGGNNTCLIIGKK